MIFILILLYKVLFLLLLFLTLSLLDGPVIDCSWQDNILVTPAGELKLVDFGMSISHMQVPLDKGGHDGEGGEGAAWGNKGEEEGLTRLLSSGCGTPLYAAPEVTLVHSAVCCSKGSSYVVRCIRHSTQWYWFSHWL
jgi:hypothetical protein